MSLKPKCHADRASNTDSSIVDDTNKLPALGREDIGNLVPRRNNVLSAAVAEYLLHRLRWRTVGAVPNVSQAVVLGLPHTSNFDALYALPALFALDLKLSIMGKHTLFKVPIFAQLLRWLGVVPINRGKKGSVLQSSIERFKTDQSLFLGLAPEGTRQYTTTWKTGFYYLALGAGVPILPVALDYKSKEVRFLSPIYPTGDIEADLPKIYQQFKGVMPKHPERLSQPLQDVNLEAARE